MAVIDIRDNPAIDLHAAQSIGNIFSAIGRAETFRKRRYDIDTMMGQVQAGESIQDAAQITRESDPAPYDKGLKGIWQQVGNFASMGHRPDVTEDLTEAILANQLKREMAALDPMYQEQLNAAKLSNEGATVDVDVAKQTAADKISRSASDAAVAKVNAKTAPEAAELNLASQAMDNQIKAYKLENYPADYQRQVLKETQDILAQRNQMGYSAEDAERAAELHAFVRKNEAEKDANKVSDDLYKARKRAYELEGMDLDNKYRKAQTEYTSRRGTGLTPNQRAAILKPAQEDLSMTTDPNAAKKWEGILKSAGFGVRQNASGQFEIYDTEGVEGGAGNPENPGEQIEQSDYSNVSFEDLLKSLMNDPNIR